MIITYFRSSSYSRWDFCPMCYFFEYVLGMQGPSNKKADKGTIVHKTLETLALMKKGKQEGKNVIVNDAIGEVSLKNVDPVRFDISNNKGCVNDVNTIAQKVYVYYTTHLKHHEWTDIDYNDCTKWVWKALKYNDGQFNPLNRTIIDAEPFFDITIPQPWSLYNFEYNGQQLEGALSIKGTIDLVTEIDKNTIEVIDWKTGRRLDWATGNEKTLVSLKEDPQVRIYHYAICNMYKKDNVLITIDFINDGGPYTIHFDKSDLVKTENMLKKRFEQIKKSQIPNLKKSWKCNKLCHFGKHTFEDTHVEPMLGSWGLMTQCEQIRHETSKWGIDQVIEDYSMPGYSVGKYKNPGEVS